MAMDTHNYTSSSDIQDILRTIIGKVVNGEVSAKDVPVPMLWGAPGVGKSTIVRELCEEMGIGFVDVRLAQMESIDIRGLPFPDEKKGNVKWLPSSIFPTTNEVLDKDGNAVLNKDGKPTVGGVIFLDELSAAPKDVQVASYELVLDRRLGGGDVYRVPDKWIIMGAGNRSCDRAVSMAMSSALANRVMHLEIDVDPKSWNIWAVRHELHPAVIGYISWKPQNLFKDKDENMERGFPTPRSWEKVSSACKMFDNEVLLRSCAYGLVGVPTGQDFMEFYKMSSQLKDVEKMMTDPNAKIKIPSRDDLKFAMTSTMVYHVWRGKDDADTANRVNGFLRIAMELPPAFSQAAVTAAREGTATVSKTKAVMTLMRNKTYKDWLAKFSGSVSDDTEV